MQKEALFKSIIPDSFHDTSLQQSCAERRSTQQTSSSLTYGEINFDSFSDIIHTIKYDLRGLSGGEIFYDLGSGSGKAVFAASLLHDFSKCCGIEILSSLHALSLECLQTWTSSSAIDSHTDIQFYEGSIFDSSLVNWTDADLILANSTCFTEDMMTDISRIAGTVAVATSHSCNTSIQMKCFQGHDSYMSLSCLAGVSAHPPFHFFMHPHSPLVSLDSLLLSLSGNMKLHSFVVTFTRPLLRKSGFRVMREIRRDMSW